MTSQRKQVCMAVSASIFLLFLAVHVGVAQVVFPIGEREATGSIKGKVTDETGAVIPGARITIVNRERGIQQTVTTDATGSFLLRDLPVGTYEVRVSSAGFSEVRRVVEVRLGESSSVSVMFAGGGPVPEGEPEPESEPESHPDRQPERPSEPEPGSTEVSQPPSVVEKAFENDIELQRWLNEQAEKKQSLQAIIPVGGKTSLFVFTTVPENRSIAYLVLGVSEPLSSARLQARLELQGKKFLGVHFIDNNSYLMVFRDE